MKGFGAGTTLHSSTLRLAAITGELLTVHQVLQGLSNVDPHFSFDAKL
jgi:hypothetical protein